MKLKPIITSLLEIDMYKLSMGQCIYHQFSGYKTTWNFKCRNVDVFFTPEMVEKLDLVFAEKDIAEGQCWMPLLEDAYVAVVGEDSLPGQKRITLDELKETPFILPNDTAVNALCRDKLFNVLEVSSDDDTSPISMVREGLGVTVLPKLSVQCEPGVRILSLEPTVKRTLGLTWSKANLTPGAAQLMGCIKRYFTEKEYK